MIRSITFVSTTTASNAMEIRDEQSNLIPFVEDIEHRLLAIRDVSQPKFHDQRIFVWLLDYPVAERIKNLDCAPDNSKDLLFAQQLSIIRVHSCSLVVNPAARLRGRECSDGTQAIQSAQPKRRARRLTTGFPHDIRHAQGRTSQGPIHLFRSGVCRRETECKRARRRKPPDQAVRSPPRIHRRAANRKLRPRKRSLGRSPT